MTKDNIILSLQSLIEIDSFFEAWDKVEIWNRELNQEQIEDICK